MHLVAWILGDWRVQVWYIWWYTSQWTSCMYSSKAFSSIVLGLFIDSLTDDTRRATLDSMASYYLYKNYCQAGVKAGVHILARVVFRTG